MAVSLGVSITQNSQDYGANKSNITVVVSATYTNGSFNRNAKNGTLTIDGTTYNFTASFNVNASTAKGTDELFRKTVDVIHNANGSKTVNASAYYETGVSSGNITATASKVLSTIPREAKLVSAPNFTDEQSPEITYTNDAGSGVNSLQACIASEDNTTIYVSYRDVSKTGTSYKFNFTTEERNILRNATPNANKLNVKFYLKTVIGDKTYVSTLTKTMTIVNGNPTISPTVKDTNTTTTALTGNSSKLIKFYSNVSASSGAKAIKGATLKSQKITNGSKSVSTSSGTFNAVESNRFVFTATDSRGNTTTNNYDADMVEYIKLSCNFGASAPDATGKFKLTVRGNYFNGSFGATSNTLSIKYRYAVSGNTMGSWQTMSYSIGDGTYTATANITGLDYKTTYKFEISATDKLATITKSKEIKSTPVFDWSGEDFNFNVPVSIYGNFIVDYITEQGTIDGWDYRKWNSGVVEAWRATTISVATTTTYGGGYYNGSVLSESIPSGMFNNTPIISASATPSNAQIYNFNIASANKTSISYYISSTKSNASANVYINIYLKGFTGG